MPSLPVPSLADLARRRHAAQARAAARARAQRHADASRGSHAVGRAQLGFAPLVTPQAIYAAAADGTIVRIDPATGRQVWRVERGPPLSAGVGADAQAVVVGTDKGDVLAFSPDDGKALWTRAASAAR